MKHFFPMLCLAASLAGPSAFAINPCTHDVLKMLECQIVDVVSGTRAKVQVTRSITTGGKRPYCTTGVVQESTATYAFFQSDAGERVDLLFARPAAPPEKPMSALEQGQTVNEDLYSAGLELQDVQAPLEITSQNAMITANLALKARIIRIYSAKEAPVTIKGSAVCEELH